MKPYTDKVMLEADPREFALNSMDQASKALLSLDAVHVEPGPQDGFRPCEREVALEYFRASPHYW